MCLGKETPTLPQVDSQLPPFLPLMPHSESEYFLRYFRLMSGDSIKVDLEIRQ